MRLLPTIGNSTLILDELVSGLQTAIILTDMEGRILFANQAAGKMLGYRTDELTGRNLSIIVTPEDLTYLYPNLLYLARLNEAFEGEVMFKRKNETLFFADLIFRPLTDPQREETIIAACIQDIDKQKRLEKILRETHFEDLVKVANGIAHELRNPLVGIGGFVNRLYKSCQASGDEDKYYSYIITNLLKIENLVKKVDLLVSLPKPFFTEESFRELAEEAVGPYLPRLKEQRVDFINNLNEETVYVDKELVLKVVSILIDNALDALAAGGEIMIDGEIEDNRYLVRVADTGSGISPDDIRHIFNPFFSTKADGSGIDLAVVKRIVESHGGEMEVSSEVGGGTAFLLGFPLERRRPIRTSLLGE